jgi:hypothetical protein
MNHVPLIKEVLFLFLQRWLPEVSLVFVSLRSEWQQLIPLKKGESMGQERR